MTGQPQEVPINRWQVNQQALVWLKKAKVPANPLQPYVIQLAVWGLEEADLTTSDPIAPSEPTPEGVSQLTYGLLKSGAEPAHRAMQLLLSNPNLDQQEQQENLEYELAQAGSPERAAEVVLETIHDLMVALSD
jgi:hypothetical protein